jgi:signal transduction histidine kinase/CheY-like chemotaxis protein
MQVWKRKKTPPLHAQRAERLITSRLGSYYRETDWLFGWMLLAQFAATVILRFRLTGEWASQSFREETIDLLLTQALITLLPFVLIIFHRGEVLTRHVVAISLLSWSVLLTHVSGGVVDPALHIFGTLSLLSSYRDRKLLISTTLVVLLIYLDRYWWECAQHPWVEREISLELACQLWWVAIMNVVLMIMMKRSKQPLFHLAAQQAALEEDCALTKSEMDRQTKQLLQQGEELRHAHKMEAIGRMAGGIAHDFNNLLTVITGYASVLLTAPRSPDQIHANLREIQAAAARATSLTRQLLVFSRKQILKPKILQVNSLIKEMQKMLQRLIGEDIELRTELSANLGHVYADPGQMQQVILNIVVNARDAMPQGGTLSIQTESCFIDETFRGPDDNLPAGPYVGLVFTDTGCGIAEAIRDRIFEPFFTTKTADEGTGLGLATVYGIVKQSGGFVNIESQVGQGAIFRVYFPELFDCSDSVRQEFHNQSIPGGTETILLVEDDDDVRTLCKLILSAHGYHVLESSDGLQGWQALENRRGPIDLVLTDLVMPRMNGVQLAKKMREKYPELLVLYMSGYTADKLSKYGMDSEMDHLILKPFTPSSLLLKVRDLLESKKRPSSFQSEKLKYQPLRLQAALK